MKNSFLKPNSPLSLSNHVASGKKDAEASLVLRKVTRRDDAASNYHHHVRAQDRPSLEKPGQLPGRPDDGLRGLVPQTVREAGHRVLDEDAQWLERHPDPHLNTYRGMDLQNTGGLAGNRSPRSALTAPVLGLSEPEPEADGYWEDLDGDGIPEWIPYLQQADGGNDHGGFRADMAMVAGPSAAILAPALDQSAAQALTAPMVFWSSPESDERSRKKFEIAFPGALATATQEYLYYFVRNQKSE